MKLATITRQSAARSRSRRMALLLLAMTFALSQTSYASEIPDAGRFILEIKPGADEDEQRIADHLKTMNMMNDEESDEPSLAKAVDLHDRRFRVRVVVAGRCVPGRVDGEHRVRCGAAAQRRQHPFVPAGDEAHVAVDLQAVFFAAPE